MTSLSPKNGASLHKKVIQAFNSLKHFYKKDIWEFGLGDDHTAKGQWKAVFRILAISWDGIVQNRVFSRAAALSYATLMALGPLIAIIVFLSSSFIKTDAETQIKNALTFIAPSLKEYIIVDSEGASNQDQEVATALDSLISQIVSGAESLISDINTSGSRVFSVLGVIFLIWIAIQLLTSIETSLNQIWGVRRGRTWMQRVVFYWTFVSLGAVLGLGSTAMFSAINIAQAFQSVPLSTEITYIFLSLTPVLSYLMLVILLCLFYMFFPNTTVLLKPALVGSLITALLLVLNNYLSILYVQRVISLQSLYGSVGIIPVFMFGIYFFWILILLGGQITYAVQNVSVLTNQQVWERISPITREFIALAAFIRIARSFHHCLPPPSTTELSRGLKVPINVLNESIALLDEFGWVTKVDKDKKEDGMEVTGYQPARPISSISLSAFRRNSDFVGNSSALNAIIASDPILQRFSKALEWHVDDEFCRKNMDTLIDEYPVHTSQGL